MVAHSFAIAQAKYNGHDFSADPVLYGAVLTDAKTNLKFIPLEKWKNYPHSGQYITFAANDLPGLGYIIAFTSKLFGNKLTSIYAFVLQILSEMVALLIFVFLIYKIYNKKVAWISGLLYIFGYPFIWAVSSQPMRDGFVLAQFSVYLAALFLVIKSEKIIHSFFALILIGTVSAMLWIRPSVYYFMLAMPVLFFFAGKQSFWRRVVVAVIAFMLPFIIFGHQYKKFNTRHYGVKSVNYIGVSIWQGMGNIKDNPYGFKLDDNALIPFAEKHGFKGTVFSVQMNTFFWEYVKEFIKEHPGYYFKSVLKRIMVILINPVRIVPPYEAVPYLTSGLSPFEYLLEHPVDFSIKVLEFLPGILFFNVGILIFLFLLLKKKENRLELVLIMSPLFYTLATLLPLHFEPRYLTTGAWVLILPFALLIAKKSTSS